MKKILDALDNDTPGSNEEISRAYIYAFLAFLASVLKAQSDVQHLWFGRRAATRVKNELMSSIYEKALKRKDFSGIVDSKDTPATASDGGTNGKASKDTPGKKEKKGSKEVDTKSGADVGKIVQLMSGDTNRIGFMISGMYMLYVSRLFLTSPS
jgi:ABC-type multidrug transport system fused ATPase/permease subunit